jgi:MraZ protein
VAIRDAAGVATRAYSNRSGKPMVFTDAFERTLDAKNRIQIPAEFRKVMDPKLHGEAFYLCPGERKNTLSLYPERTFHDRAKQLRTEEIAGADPLAFEQLYYSLASRLEMDKQGRVVLQERLLNRVELGREVTLAGAHTRIDVWNTAEYTEFVNSSFEAQWPELQKFMRQTLASHARESRD